MDNKQLMNQAVQSLNLLRQELQEEHKVRRRDVQTLKQEVRSLLDLHTKLTADVCSRQQKEGKTASDRIAIQMLNRTGGLVREDIQRLVMEFAQTLDLVYTLQTGGQTTCESERKKVVQSSEDPGNEKIFSQLRVLLVYISFKLSPHKTYYDV